MKKFQILILISTVLFHYLSNGVEAVDCNVEPKNAEGRLRKNLFCDYDKDNRPILTDGPITIQFKMIIKGFMFDDLDGKLTVSTWLAMTWTDEHLRWDPKDYNNLPSITQSSSTIWQPDLSLYNSDVASAAGEFCKDANCVITHSGRVSCIPPCSHTAKCTPNYDRWPFDRQNCTLHIGTWVNSGEEIDFKVLKTIITEDELSSQNMEWRLTQATYKRNSGNFSESKQTYPSLTFSFVIDRHSATNGACILATALVLVLLNVVSLWVDSTSNQRLTLLSLSLFGHWVFLQHLLWIMPHNGDSIPDMLLFFRDSILITGFLIVNTIIMQGLMTCKVQTPEWIEKTTSYMESNRFGQFFMTKHLITNSFTSQIDSNDDDINLVESQANQEKDSKKVSPKIWQTFGNVIDRILFAVLTIMYIIMLVSLLPENFLDEKEVTSVEIIGY